MTLNLKINANIGGGVKDFQKFLPLPVLIDVLDLIDLLLDALAGHAVGLELVHLLVDQV